MVKNSIIVSAINCWNETQNILGGQSLKFFINKPKLKTYTQMHQQTPLIC